MADKHAKPIRDRLHWDTEEWIDAIEDLIQSRINLDRAIACTTLGAFETLVQNQIESERSESDQEFTRRVLRDINAAAVKHISDPISEKHLSSSIEDVARSARPGPWRDVYFIIANHVFVPVPKVRPTLVSKAALALMLVIAAVIVYALWAGVGWVLGACSAPILLIAILATLIWLPARVVGEPPTLGDAIEHYRLFLGEARTIMDQDDIRAFIRDSFKQWSSKHDENDPIDGTEDISWVWIDTDSKPLAPHPE